MVSVNDDVTKLVNKLKSCDVSYTSSIILNVINIRIITQIGKLCQSLEFSFFWLCRQRLSSAADILYFYLTQTDADTVTENSVIAEYLFFSESDKKKSWVKMWCVIPKDELCIYFYGSHQVNKYTLGIWIRRLKIFTLFLDYVLPAFYWNTI